MGYPNSWMVYKFTRENPIHMDDDWWYPYDLGNLHLVRCLPLFEDFICSELNQFNQQLDKSAISSHSAMFKLHVFDVSEIRRSPLIHVHQGRGSKPCPSIRFRPCGPCSPCRRHRHRKLLRCAPGDDSDVQVQNRWINQHVRGERCLNLEVYPKMHGFIGKMIFRWIYHQKCLDQAFYSI